MATPTRWLLSQCRGVQGRAASSMYRRCVKKLGKCCSLVLHFEVEKECCCCQWLRPPDVACCKRAHSPGRSLQLKDLTLPRLTGDRGTERTPHASSPLNSPASHCRLTTQLNLLGLFLFPPDTASTDCDCQHTLLISLSFVCLSAAVEFFFGT